jgi:hypothetical protein
MALDHPRIPASDVIACILNDKASNHAGMHAFAGRRVPIMKTEVVMGTEMGLLACWPRHGRYPPLAADLIRTLLDVVVKLQGCGCMDTPQTEPNGAWVGDPGLYSLNSTPTDIAGNTAGWKGLHRSHTDTRALVPLNIHNQHWTLLEIDATRTRCTLFDSLPYTACDSSLREHILATTRTLFPRTAAPMAFNTHIIERQYEGSNDCGIHVFINAWRATSKTPLRRYTYHDVRAIRELWLPALVFSNTAPGQATPYPHTYESTIAAFGEWLNADAIQTHLFIGSRYTTP